MGRCEAAFRDMTAALARALELGAPQDWPLEQAIVEWGYEMASYGLGSNSRVRGTRAASCPAGGRIVPPCSTGLAATCCAPSRRNGARSVIMEVSTFARQ